MDDHVNVESTWNGWSETWLWWKSKHLWPIWKIPKSWRTIQIICRFPVSCMFPSKQWRLPGCSLEVVCSRETVVFSILAILWNSCRKWNCVTQALFLTCKNPKDSFRTARLIHFSHRRATMFPHIPRLSVRPKRPLPKRDKSAALEGRRGHPCEMVQMGPNGNHFRGAKWGHP